MAGQINILRFLQSAFPGSLTVEIEPSVNASEKLKLLKVFKRYSFIQLNDENNKNDSDNDKSKLAI